MYKRYKDHLKFQLLIMHSKKLYKYYIISTLYVEDQLKFQIIYSKVGKYYYHDTYILIKCKLAMHISVEWIRI